VHADGREKIIENMSAPSIKIRNATDSKQLQPGVNHDTESAMSGLGLGAFACAADWACI
jgi:hypothetical protein